MDWIKFNKEVDFFWEDNSEIYLTIKFIISGVNHIQAEFRQITAKESDPVTVCGYIKDMISSAYKKSVGVKPLSCDVNNIYKTINKTEIYKYYEKIMNGEI